METLRDTNGDVLSSANDCEPRYITAIESFARGTGLEKRTQLMGRAARQFFPAIPAAGYEPQYNEAFDEGATL